MAAKKADLEQHRAEYQARVREARSHEGTAKHGEALAAALSAFCFIDGMMQYERKYEEAEFDSVAAIEIVLKYAPLLFRHDALNQVADLLKQYKRIEKHTEADLAQRLTEARTRMRLNHRLFTYLEAYPESRQDELRQRLGGDQDYWRSTSEAWERMGLLEREPLRFSYRLAFVTRLGQVVAAKCPACGHVAYAPKGMFLEETTCDRCRKSVFFVFVGAAPAEPREV